MSAGDLLKADDAKTAPADEVDPNADAVGEEAGSLSESVEAQDDDAWLDACRDEIASGPEDAESASTNSDAVEDDEAAIAAGEDVKDFSDGVATLSADLEKLRRRNDDTEIDAALADLAKRIAAMEKTGNDAMSTLGQAMTAIADRIDDLEERSEQSAFDSAVEKANPSQRRDNVAPYIENAERELEAAKDGGGVDIFDRIALAAESQFDESRGTTAQRVSKLVDDRRVGTKRWTPSKTVKARMAKLEAARISAEEAAASETPSAKAAQPVTDAVAPPAPEAEKAEAPATPIEDRVVISRREKQPPVEESIADETVSEETAAEADAAALEEDDDAALRVIPGARGRRRDRARKSRLDEDFEKIFDDDSKPSIGSLRRKLRSGASTDETAEPAETSETGDASVTEETFGAAATVTAPAAKTNLFSRIFKRKTAPTATVTAEADDAADSMVAAFEVDEKDAPLDIPLEDSATEAVDGEAWEQQVVENERRQRQISTPIIVTAIAIIAGGAGYFLYKTLFG